MISRIVTRAAPGLFMGLMAAWLLPPHKALAQAALPAPTSMGPVVQGSNGNQQAQPSVAGLPGARSSGPVNQGSVSSSMLSPNDELFDAINRGDISAARDALSRGADLSATDAVGQTPIDLSVALARNNITFLLVTLLHATGGGIVDAQGPMAEPPANTLGLSATDQKAVSAPIGFFTARPAGTPAGKYGRKSYQTAETAAAPAPATTVSQSAYAGGSGSADPAAGFVGFGAGAQ